MNPVEGERKIAEVGELGLIKKIRSKNFPFKKSLVGIGDDAAVISWKEGKLLAITTDSFVEDIHFSLSWASFQDIGYKALAATLSDLAAMAAEPVGFLVSLGMPPNYKEKFIDDLYEGFFGLASDFEVELMGGDIVASRIFFVSLTAFGSVEKGVLRLRSQASAGETVMVTGKLGYSALGLRALKKGFLPGSEGFEAFAPYIRAHLRPYPRVREARIFSHSGARAMEDISDGLASEVIHVAEESKVRIEIYSDKLPLEESFKEAAFQVEADPLNLVLYGGEDFELMFTVPPEKVPLVFTEAKKMGLMVTEVGKVLEGEGAWLMVEGKEKPLKPGYEHFKD